MPQRRQRTPRKPGGKADPRTFMRSYARALSLLATTEPVELRLRLLTFAADVLEVPVRTVFLEVERARGAGAAPDAEVSA